MSKIQLKRELDSDESITRWHTALLETMGCAVTTFSRTFFVLLIGYICFGSITVSVYVVAVALEHSVTRVEGLLYIMSLQTTRRRCTCVIGHNLA